MKKVNLTSDRWWRDGEEGLIGTRKKEKMLLVTGQVGSGVGMSEVAWSLVPTTSQLQPHLFPLPSLVSFTPLVPILAMVEEI